jgi:sterol desaturase/sphingolipid hydroxylase (fatty acid hydroxylase superfamily)
VRVRYGSDVKTVAAAWRAFRRKRSPRILAAGVALALAARILVGDVSWADAAAAALMVPVYVFGEWAIHVHLLHLRPFRWRGRRVELMTAASHRQHHEDPHNLNLILLGPWEAVALLALAVPLVPALGGGIAALLWGAFPVGPALTALLAGYVLVLVYEWTHFLIHTAHRPRSRYYRAIWRGHRLHHFKNERYWHGITNTVSDRVLGTAPDQKSVPRSATARTLRP